MAAGRRGVRSAPGSQTTSPRASDLEMAQLLTEHTPNSTAGGGTGSSKPRRIKQQRASEREEVAALRRGPASDGPPSP